MGDLYEQMRVKLLDVVNPDVEYSLEDFNKQFSVNINGSSKELKPIKMDIQFINTSTNDDPKYETFGSSGFDIRADLSSFSTETTYIDAGKFKVIPTGLFFELPPNFELQIRPRSGLAAKHGVTVLNAPGTVDNDYRGEVKVILINHGEKTFFIEHGDRIAQGVMAPLYSEKSFFNFKKVDALSATERLEGGFGSTGVK